jgi:hypothetical protein
MTATTANREGEQQPGKNRTSIEEEEQETGTKAGNSQVFRRSQARREGFIRFR